jgi:hypothetical protein
VVIDANNLTPNPFPSGKGNRIDRTLGAGVTPAEGSVKPIAGFTFNYSL